MDYAEKKGGCEMEREELRKVLDLHEKWVRKESEGVCANFAELDLRRADFWRADLQGADLDFSAWPLWCGSLEAYIDDRIAIQLLYHLICPVQASPYVSQEVKDRLLTDELTDLANRFHRIEECGKIKK